MSHRKSHRAQEFAIPHPAAGDALSPARPGTGKVNVLLVDDQPANLIALEALLSPLGENLVCAGSGKTALRLLLEQPFGLILLDIQMPEMDGYELASLVRARESTRHTPIIFLTAGTPDQAHAFEGYSLAAVDFLHKPVDPEVLRAKVAVFVAMAKWTQQFQDEVAFANRVQHAVYRAHEESEQQALVQSRRLGESEEQFRLLVEGVTGYGIFMLDPDGVIATWNSGAQVLFGYFATEIVGRHLSWVFPREAADAGTADAALQRAAREGRCEEEGWRVRKDGTQFWVHAQVSALHTPDGSLRGYAQVVRDMTRQRAAEQADRERQAFVRAALESLVDGVIACDSQGVLQVFNRSVVETYGFHEALVPLAESPDLPFFRVADGSAPLPPEDAPLVRALRGETFQDVALVFAPPGRTPSALLCSGRPIRDELGNHLGAVVAMHDITERKQAEEALLASESQLRQAQKMEAIGRLAGGIAHDFNNMLSVIMGYSELILVHDGLDETTRSRLHEVLSAAERAARLTRQLLAFSRKQLLEPQLIDANELVRDLERMLARVIGEDIRLATALETEPCPVLIDPGQMEQVLMNLAVNARDAMPRGGQLTLQTALVRLEATYAHQHFAVEPGLYVQLVVSDTGCGMDRETQARVFEPFFTTKAPGEGTGLGLATVYGIVKQSGGDILVYSEPQVGTTFKIYLPCATHAQPGAVSRGGAAPVVRRGSETVLLVEDEASVRQLVRAMLEDMGYQVLEARDVREALLIGDGHESPIHLLLSDLVMPQMSGRELAECLERSRPQMKVLFMSGYTDDTIVRHGILSSDIAFIQKPFSASVLSRKLREVLDGGSAPAEA